MRTLNNVLVFAVLLASAQVQAQGMNMPMEAKPKAAPSAAPKPSFVSAEVKAVDPAKGSVTLDHQEIPNLGMPAMTMAFEVKDKKMLKGLKEGDKVRFQADTFQGRILVTKLQRSK